MIPEDASGRVCLADFNNLDINRQSSDFGDCAPHRKPLLPIDFIEVFIAENGILENPLGGKDAAYGMVSVNRIDLILAILGGESCLDPGGRQGLTASATA